MSGEGEQKCLCKKRVTQPAEATQSYESFKNFSKKLARSGSQGNSGGGLSRGPETI